MDLLFSGEESSALAPVLFLELLGTKGCINISEEQKENVRLLIVYTVNAVVSDGK